MNYSNLTLGTEIYYTGDMANIEGFGKIIEVTSDKWYPVSYTVVLEDGRIFNAVMPSGFEGIGKRFWVREEYKEVRKRQIEEFNKKYKNQ